ncbi:MAG: hypothetical protein KF831_12315 [Acidobacteria bacterium]|nr:hypothetical protein [Acidobacteriota bacterium]
MDAEKLRADAVSFARTSPFKAARGRLPGNAGRPDRIDQISKSIERKKMSVPVTFFTASVFLSLSKGKAKDRLLLVRESYYELVLFHFLREFAFWC